MNETRNVFVNFENGDSILVHINEQIKSIGCSTIKKWAEKATGNKVLEAYYIKDEEIQYYCFDDRIWIDTPEKAKKIIEFIDK